MHAEYGADGEVVLLQAVDGVQETTLDVVQATPLADGLWLVDRQTGAGRLLRDNLKAGVVWLKCEWLLNGKEMWRGTLVNSLGLVRLSPDGRRVGGIRSVLAADAGPEDNWGSLFRRGSHHLVTLDIASGMETEIMDLHELRESLKEVGANFSSLGLTWLDNRRLVCPVYWHGSGVLQPQLVTLWAVDADTGAVTEVFRAEPGERVRVMHRISPGKLLVDFQSAEAFRRMEECIDRWLLRVAQAREADPEGFDEAFEQIDREHMEEMHSLMAAGRDLAVLDLSTSVAQMRVLDVNLRREWSHDGRLSPDEEFYALVLPEYADDDGKSCSSVLILVHVGTGQYVELELGDGVFLVQGWHPDGRRLLCMPDPASRVRLDQAPLVEVFVADVLHSLAQEPAEDDWWDAWEDEWSWMP